LQAFFTEKNMSGQESFDRADEFPALKGMQNCLLLQLYMIGEMYAFILRHL